MHHGQGALSGTRSSCHCEALSCESMNRQGLSSSVLALEHQFVPSVRQLFIAAYTGCVQLHRVAEPDVSASSHTHLVIQPHVFASS